jgi:UDP-N-acetylglucosamine 2-epimerase (non-hydrolysing)
MSAQRVLLVVGTRPEAIKMAPVVRRLRTEPERFAVRLCATAQHREMLDQVLRLFEIDADIDLDLMRPDQTPSALAARVLTSFDEVLEAEKPDWVLVQGDTTTAMAASLAAFHRRIKVGHVEAGLRTGDLSRPFPEEMNRRVVDVVAGAYFVPTARAHAALQSEGVPAARLHRTGNTVVDALLSIAARRGEEPEENLVLVTAHRRESFGEPLAHVVSAVSRLARAFPQTRVLHVAHPNPRVREALAGYGRLPNVSIVEPLDYDQLVSAMRRSRLILTDSGGIQEEAPTFHKPVLVLRERTERPEGLEAGLARLVGTDEEAIVAEATRLLESETARREMSAAVNPYGDGHAADRIAAALSGRPYAPFEAPAPRFALA